MRMAPSCCQQTQLVGHHSSAIASSACCSLSNDCLYATRRAHDRPLWPLKEIGIGLHRRSCTSINGRLIRRYLPEDNNRARADQRPGALTRLLVPVTFSSRSFSSNATRSRRSCLHRAGHLAASGHLDHTGATWRSWARHRYSHGGRVPYSMIYGLPARSPSSASCSSSSSK